MSGTTGRAAAIALVLSLAVSGCSRDSRTSGDRGGGGGRLVALPGSIHTVAGTGVPGFNGDGRPARESNLTWPDDVAFDPEGRLVVLDWNNHRVRMVRTDGLVVTVAGNGFPGAGTGHSEDVSLFHPTGVAFDPVPGDLLVADWHSRRVKRHSFLADELTPVAGSGSPGFGGDGGDPATAILDLPSSVAVAPDGTIYVTDEGNGRVRRIAGGVIDTFAGTGAAGFSGDGGPAAGAQLREPHGLALDE